VAQALARLHIKVPDAHRTTKETVVLWVVVPAVPVRAKVYVPASVPPLLPPVPLLLLLLQPELVHPTMTITATRATKRKYTPKR
jgi:hypothetical protein